MESTMLTAPTTVDISLTTALKQRLTGPMLLPGDEGYHEARKVWNGMIDRYPALIVRCRNTHDIILAVNFASQHELLLSVKGGGHNVTGNAVCDGGIMVDLSLMKDIKVDAGAQVADVEMGVTWGEFDKATQAYGLATTGGVVSTTGVAGLTLGGGVGWLVRKHGLSCDNLLEAQIVTAEGILLTASTTENADLFWGIRGGGGNFGIVTSMKFRLHKVDTVLGGVIIHSRDDAKDLLRFYREFMKTAPDELTLYAAFITSPEGLPVVALAGCYAGNPETGNEVLKPLHGFGSPVADLMGPIPYLQLQGLLDAAVPHGNRYYWKSNFLEALSDDAIDVIVSHANAATSPLSMILLEKYGGASDREPEGGTAFPHRHSLFDLVIVSNWADKQEDSRHTAWARNFWDAIQPFSSHKVYVNVLGVEGEDRVKEAYGDLYPRLAELKRKYDPANLFQVNQNIKPVEI
jgi:FAD/FMN-containing dehydrogenase